MKTSFYIFLFLVAAAKTFSQSLADSSTLIIGSQAHYGFILPHSHSIADLAYSNPWGLQVEISRIRNTQDSWNSCNCLSQNGISFMYFNFNNRQVLGSSANLVIFAEPQFLYGRINLGLRAGMGLSYLTRVYNMDSNPQNLFFSNPLSALLLVQLNSRIPLNDHWSLRVASSYNHISNGGRRQPNKGINFPTISIGTAYTLHPLSLRPRTKIRLTDRSLHYYGGIFYNTRTVEEPGAISQQRKPVIGIQVGFYKPFARMHAMGLVMEASYDGSLKEQARQGPEMFDHRIISGLVRHHLLFGKFDFSQALGVYLFKDYLTSHPVFQRYAIDYPILPKIRLGFSLKAHLHVAEQMDLRLIVAF